MDRYFSEHPYHYPIWGYQPSSLNESQKIEVYSIVERAAKALKIDSGPVKADIIFTKKGPYILEIAPRFHGDVSTSFVTPLVTEGSPIKTWFAHLRGTSKPEKYLGRMESGFAGWMGLFPDTIGKIQNIRGVSEAKKTKGISQIFISKKIGDIIKPAQDNTALCGFIWGKSDSSDDLFCQLTECRNRIKFSVK